MKLFLNIMFYRMGVHFVILNTLFIQLLKGLLLFNSSFYIFTALACFSVAWMFVHCAALWRNKRNNKNLYIGRFWKQFLSRCFMCNLLVLKHYVTL